MASSARALAFVLLLLPGVPAVADDDEPVPIQRYLESLRLGDYLREVQIVYPPLREWPSFREPGGKITKYHVERAYAKNFPWDIDSLRLGFRWGRLAVIQAVYNERFSKEKPLEKIVVDLSLIYGEPSRHGMVYSWRDRSTEIRVFNEEQPSPDGSAVELHPSIEVSERGARERVD